MKLFSLLVAALLAVTVFAPSTASAGHGRTRITYETCGTRVHWVYSCVGHDYYGRPIYRWLVHSRFPARGIRHHYGHHYRPHHGHGYHRGHGGSYHHRDHSRSHGGHYDRGRGHSSRGHGGYRGHR